jgi:hypothetical protein
MKVTAISSTEGVSDLLVTSQGQGYLTFLYHHADPEHKLLRDKFLYVHDDEELVEKLKLMKLDMTAQDLIRL